MDNTVITISGIACFIILCVVLKFNIWKIIKLIFNSLCGGVLIFFINQIGVTYGLHIGLNLVTSMFIGVFGIPGAVLLIVLKIF